MGQNLTPEELDVIRQIIAARNPTPDAGSPESYGVPQATPTAPDPYTAQASKYKAQADTLDQQAATPYPQPKGVGESIVAGLRNGMESFGRLGAPNGTEGQEALRQKNFADENKSRVEQAKALREQAQSQQDLGQRTNYEAATVQNQKDQNAQTKSYEDSTVANQQATEKRMQQAADDPVGNDIPAGGRRVFTDRHTGAEIPNTEIDGPEKPTASYNLETKVVDEGGGKFGYHAFDMRNGGKDVGRMGDAPAPGANGGGGPLGLVAGTSTDANGNPIAGVTNLRANTFTPSHYAGDKSGAPVQTAAAGNANVKVAGANMKSDEDRDASLAAMKSLIAESAKNPNSAYINDQGLVDQFFNIVKPDSGARMNQSYIQNLLTPGPAADKFWAFTQKISNGAPLTQADREYMGQAAQIVADAKRHSTGNAAAPKPAATGGGTVIKYDNKGNRIQ